MTAPAFALQTAICERLGDDAALAGLLADEGIYDAPVAGARFPYVTFGRATGSDWSSAQERGQEVFLTLQVWSNRRGRSETAGIVERIDECLRDWTPEMDGLRLVLLDRDLVEIRYDSDLSIYRGSVRYRALLEEVAAA